MELNNSILLPIGKIKPNKGQLEGLKKNPRLAKDEKYRLLVKSLQDNPEMLALRELLVYPMDDGTYIIIGGNMRYHAMKELGYKECPVKVIPKETSVETLAAYVLKDNSSYGEWDIHLLREWDVELLNDCCIELKDVDELNPDELSDGFTLPNEEKSDTRITFTLSNEQAEFINSVIAKTKNEAESVETFGNENKNGNTLYYIIQQWESARR
jgi:hypothetical protein